MSEIVKLYTFILRIILIKFILYLAISINIVEENRFSSREYKNRRKSENKKIKILTKLKSRNLPKFKFKNLFRSKNIQSSDVIY